MAYTVHVEPGKREGVWVLQCLEVPGALSETTDLREAPALMREAIAFVAQVPSEGIDVVIKPPEHALPE